MTKFKFKYYFFAFVMGLLLFVSCSREINYEFQVINETNYKIDSLEFSCATKANPISVNSNSSTEIFSVNYRRIILPLSEPLMCYTVTAFSDSSNHFHNNSGSMYSISELKKRKTNTIRIRYRGVLNANYPNDIFDMSVN